VSNARGQRSSSINNAQKVEPYMGRSACVSQPHPPSMGAAHRLIHRATGAVVTRTWRSAIFRTHPNRCTSHADRLGIRTGRVAGHGDTTKYSRRCNDTGTKLMHLGPAGCDAGLPTCISADGRRRPHTSWNAFAYNVHAAARQEKTVGPPPGVRRRASFYLRSQPN
jgi:hypothetical protein